MQTQTDSPRPASKRLFGGRTFPSPLALCLLLCACTDYLDPEGENSGSDPNIVVTGPGRYFDRDGDGRMGPADEIVLSFNVDLSINTSDATAFSLPVNGDGFGTGATLIPGPGSKDVTVRLGLAPTLRCRGSSLSSSLAGGPSRIGLSPNLPVDAIESKLTGRDLKSMSEVDVVPMLESQGSPSGMYSSAHFTVDDLNQDGIRDLATADGVEGLAVYEGLFGGSYKQRKVILGISHRVIVSDVRGLGQRDLLVLTDLNLHVVNNWSKPGGFINLQPAGAFPVPSPAADMALIDSDGDGDLDVALCTDAGVFIVRNDGGGALNPSGTPLPGSRLNGASIQAEDINRDGLMDLFISTAGSDSDQILLGDGCGQFTPLPVFDNGDHRIARIHDYNGDGELDFFLAGEQGKVRIFRGVGNLNYIEQPGLSAGTGRISALALLDIDLDGNKDIAFCDGGQVHLRMSDGLGQFTSFGSALGAGNMHALVPADMDGDGDEELLGTSTTTPLIWRNSGVGGWGLPAIDATSTAIGQGPMIAMATGDLSGDGLDDLVLSQGNSISIQLNTGLGKFGAPQNILLGSGVGMDIELADLNADGHLDVVVALVGTGPNLWLNNGAGFFVPAGTTETRNQIAVLAGDLNGDRFVDLVWGTPTGQPDSAALNLGLDCWAASGQSWRGLSSAIYLPTSAETTAIAIGDADSDGLTDIVLGRKGGLADEVLKGNGYGGFYVLQGAIPAHNTNDLSLADITGDGHLDLCLATDTGLQALSQAGTGMFQYYATLALGPWESVELLDLNQDAWADVQAIDSAGNSIQAWMGTRSGAFAPLPDWTFVQSGLRHVLWLQMDSDATDDLLLGVGDTGTSSVHLSY